MTALLAAENLVKHFPARRDVFGRPRAWVKAVDGVSFELKAGDLIFTCTPSGVGATKQGDRLKGHVDGIGDLEVIVT